VIFCIARFHLIDGFFIGLISDQIISVPIIDYFLQSFFHIVSIYQKKTAG